MTLEEKDISEMTTRELIDAYAEIYCSSTADKGFSGKEQQKLDLLQFAISERCNNEDLSPEGIVFASTEVYSNTCPIKLILASAEVMVRKFPNSIKYFISERRRSSYHHHKRVIHTITKMVVSENA